MRTEVDSLGEVQVPSDMYYGAVTARAHANLNIGGSMERMPVCNYPQLSYCWLNLFYSVVFSSASSVLSVLFSSILFSSHQLHQLYSVLFSLALFCSLLITSILFSSHQLHQLYSVLFSSASSALFCSLLISFICSILFSSH